MSAICRIMLHSLCWLLLIPLTAFGLPGSVDPWREFAHRSLPEALKAKPRLALDLALSKRNRELLAALWETGVKRSGPVSGQGEPLIKVSRVAEDRMAVLFTPSEPGPSETLAVCLILSFKITSADQVQLTGTDYYRMDAFPVSEPGAGPTNILRLDARHGTFTSVGPGPAMDRLEAFVEEVLWIHYQVESNN